MEQSVSKKSFFSISFILIFSFVLEVGYLSFKTKNLAPLNEFVKLTSFSSPAFFSNTPYLRHRNLKNPNVLFGLHPGLHESKTATFIQSAPIK